MNAAEIAQHLNMEPHPEGGYFKEVYRSSEMVGRECLPLRFNGKQRSTSTAIYFLLETGSFSAFHRIKSDEIWHHYEGVALDIFVIYPNGSMEIMKLGKNFSDGEEPIRAVPHGCWFASRVATKGFALVGCTVAPGFDFSDFEIGDRKVLLDLYPQHADIVKELTR